MAQTRISRDHTAILLGFAAFVIAALVDAATWSANAPAVRARDLSPVARAFAEAPQIAWLYKVGMIGMAAFGVWLVRWAQWGEFGLALLLWAFALLFLGGALTNVMFGRA